VNVKALEAYLQGEYHFHRYGRGFGDSEAKTAVSYFQQAAAEDPSFAEPYVAMDNAYEASMLPQDQKMQLERDAAEKALALDPNLAEAHVSMGRVKFFYEWDLAGAEREFKRAIELSPSSAEAHAWFAAYLSSMRRLDEAKAEAELAQRLDPFHFLSQAYSQPGDEDRAIASLRNYIEFNPDDGVAHLDLAEFYARKRMQKEHVGELQRTATLFGFPKVASAYATSGYQAALRTWAVALVSNGVNRPAMVAKTYAQLGDKDLAFRWLERAYRERDHYLIELDADAVWDPLRLDPRFADLVRRVGLPR
jgi:tetratricopeptide (TPR) repeat protein